MSTPTASTSSNFLRLHHLHANPARAEFGQQDVGHRFGKRFEQLQLVLAQQAAQAFGDHAVVDGVADAVGVTGLGARQPAWRSMTRGWGRWSSLAWMPITVWPTRPSMKIRSIGPASRSGSGA